MEDVICQRCATVNDYHIVVAGPHNKAICNNCDRYIKFISQNKDIQFWIGKYKGTFVKDCNDSQYLLWFLNETDPKEGTKQAIEDRLKTLTPNK